jgi:hypothetical protein
MNHFISYPVFGALDLIDLSLQEAEELGEDDDEEGSDADEGEEDEEEEN